MLEELAFVFCCVPELQAFLLNVCLCCFRPTPPPAAIPEALAEPLTAVQNN